MNSAHEWGVRVLLQAALHGTASLAVSVAVHVAMASLVRNCGTQYRKRSHLPKLTWLIAGMRATWRVATSPHGVGQPRHIVASTTAMPAASWETHPVLSCCMSLAQHFQNTAQSGEVPSLGLAHTEKADQKELSRRCGSIPP